MIVAKLVAGARRSQCARFLRSLSGWEAAQRPIWRKIDAPDTSDATKTQNSTLTQAFSLVSNATNLLARLPQPRLQVVLTSALALFLQGPLIWKRLYSEGAQIE